MTTILAFDQSTDKNGWCLVDTVDGHVMSGAFSLKKICESITVRGYKHSELDPGWIRLTRLPIELRKIRRLCYHLVESVDIVAVEEPCGNHGNLLADRKLGAALGIIISVFSGHCDEIVMVHPMQVKKTGCSKSNAASMAAAAAFAGKESVSRDEADAIGVALAAIAKIKEREWSK